VLHLVMHEKIDGLAKVGLRYKVEDTQPVLFIPHGMQIPTAPLLSEIHPVDALSIWLQ